MRLPLLKVLFCKDGHKDSVHLSQIFDGQSPLWLMAVVYEVQQGILEYHLIVAHGLDPKHPQPMKHDKSTQTGHP